MALVDPRVPHECPGQTMGMAVFTDPFIEAFGLNRTKLSLAYLFGTVSSSFFLTTAGRWFDQFGGRFMVTASSIALGAMVVFISVTDQLAHLLGTNFAPFGLDFHWLFWGAVFGQGVLTSCSRNVLMPGLFVVAGLSLGCGGLRFYRFLAPLLLAWLIAVFGWREALWVLAAIVGLVFLY